MRLPGAVYIFIAFQSPTTFPSGSLNQANQPMPGTTCCGISVER